MNSAPGLQAFITSSSGNGDTAAINFWAQSILRKLSRRRPAMITTRWPSVIWFPFIDTRMALIAKFPFVSRATRISRIFSIISVFLLYHEWRWSYKKATRLHTQHQCWLPSSMREARRFISATRTHGNARQHRAPLMAFIKTFREYALKYISMKQQDTLKEENRVEYRRAPGAASRYWSAPEACLIDREYIATAPLLYKLPSIYRQPQASILAELAFPASSLAAHHYHAQQRIIRYVLIHDRVWDYCTQTRKIITGMLRPPHA